MSVADLLPEIAVLLCAVAIVLLASFLPQRRQALCAAVALIGLAVAAMLCMRQLAAPPHLAFAGSWAIDGASIWARLLIVISAAVTILSTPEWLRSDRRHGEYYAVMLLSTLGAMMMAAASDSLELVVGILLASITGYVMTAYHRDWAISGEAGIKYFLLGGFANSLLMVGIALLYGLLGSTNYSVMAATLAAAPHSPLLLTSLALVLVGIGFKLGAVPAHAWLPDVAQGAPAPAAAFLTVVPKIGAAVAMLRLLVLFDDTLGWRLLIASMAVATMTLGNLAALWQTDLRRLLGWSSVSQAGYVLMAVTVVGLSDQALPALLLFLAGYAAANLAAFAVVTQLRGRTALSDYRGLAAQRPWAAAVLTLTLLSLVGIPPLAGFAGKLMLFWATLDSGYGVVAVAALVNTVISLFYYLRVLTPVYFDRVPQQPIEQLGGFAAWALAVTALAVVGIGFGAGALLAVFGTAPPLP
jgi:NADH-quinone oxidoreductase subunit N